jgi:hypothetical protein
MRHPFTAVFFPLALAALAARADVNTFGDWVGRTKLGVMLERTETTVRFVIHAGSAWDDAPPAWKARLGRHTFCDDLRLEFPWLESYAYYVKLVRTLAPNERIFDFPTTYERSGSGTAADCLPPVFLRGRR